MATKVKTEAATDIPCTRPLILHTVLVNGQPFNRINVNHQAYKKMFYFLLQRDLCLTAVLEIVGV